jgi:Lhr-like helicase
MNDQTSQVSSGQLHEEVQRWIWSQGWDKLRPIQEQAIAPILSGNTDLIISAATAGGKTEAAFLPMFSGLLRLIRELTFNRDFKIGFSRTFSEDRHPSFAANF